MTKDKQTQIKSGGCRLQPFPLPVTTSMRLATCTDTCCAKTRVLDIVKGQWQ